MHALPSAGLQGLHRVSQEKSSEARFLDLGGRGKLNVGAQVTLSTPPLIVGHVLVEGLVFSLALWLAGMRFDLQNAVFRAEWHKGCPNRHGRRIRFWLNSRIMRKCISTCKAEYFVKRGRTRLRSDMRGKSGFD